MSSMAYGGKVWIGDGICGVFRITYTSIIFHMPCQSIVQGDKDKMNAKSEYKIP